jgi:hypothetical protein
MPRREERPASTCAGALAVGWIDRRRIEAVGVLNLDPTLGGRSAPLKFADDVADHIDEPVMSLSDYTGRLAWRHSNISIYSALTNNTAWLFLKINHENLLITPGRQPTKAPTPVQLDDGRRL